MGKWQRRGPRPSPLTETIPSVQLEGGGSLFSPKNFSVTPQALTVKHTDFSVLSTSRRSLGPFFASCVGNRGWMLLFSVTVEFMSTLSELPQRGIPSQSSREQSKLFAVLGNKAWTERHFFSKQLPAESKMVLILQPMCTLSSYFSSKVDTSEHWVRPHRAWVHLSGRSPCLHVKALT